MYSLEGNCDVLKEGDGKRCGCKTAPVELVMFEGRGRHSKEEGGVKRDDIFRRKQFLGWRGSGE